MLEGVNKKRDEEILSQFVTNFDSFYPKFPHIYRKLEKNIYESFSSNPDFIYLINVISEKGNEKCQKILIKDRTLGKMISLISEDKSTEDVNVDQKDSDYSELYLSLEHCAKESTRIAFIRKNLNLLKTIKNNRLFPYQKFAIENLKSAQLPNSLQDSEDEFYNIIAGAVNQLRDPQERVTLIEVVFKYFDKISSDKQKDFIQRLKNNINALDANFSKPLISIFEPLDIDESIKEEIWEAIMKRSLGLMDEELLEKVFGHYRDREEIESFFKNITERNINTAVDIVRKFKDELPRATANTIIQVFVNKSRGLPFSQLPLLFDLIVEIIGISYSEYKNMFADRLLELVKSTDNVNNQQIGLRYIDEVIDRIPRTKWEYVSQQLVRALPSPITAYNLPVLSNIIEGILKLQDYLPEEGRIDLIDFLLPMAKDNTLPKEFRDKGFEFLARVKRLPRKRKKQIQVLEELFQVLKTEHHYFEPCSRALHNFERYKGKNNFWEKVKEFESQYQE